MRDGSEKRGGGPGQNPSERERCGYGYGYGTGSGSDRGHEHEVGASREGETHPDRPPTFLTHERIERRKRETDRPASQPAKDFALCFFFLLLLLLLPAKIPPLPPPDSSSSLQALGLHSSANALAFRNPTELSRNDHRRLLEGKRDVEAARFDPSRPPIPQV